MHNNDNYICLLDLTKCQFWFVDLASQSNAFNEIFAIEIFIAKMLSSENRKKSVSIFGVNFSSQFVSS